jgi:hypothetical protein
MATINLGRIKPVNKGTWSNATTYAVDDFVQYTDNGITSTYIAVATSSNQTPSTSGTENSTYWKFMAKGVANELSGIANNKIVYRDNSGALQGLTYGATGTALKVTGSNTLGFGTAGGVIQRKIIHDNSTGSVSSNTPVEWTPFNMTFTPTATGNILELEINSYWSSRATQWGMYFYDSTNGVRIGVGDSDGSRQRLALTSGVNNASSWVSVGSQRVYYSAPNTNATIFKIYIGTHGGTTFYHNRNNQNNNNSNLDDARVTSCFTITEYASGVYTGSGQENI